MKIHIFYHPRSRDINLNNNFQDCAIKLLNQECACELLPYMRCLIKCFSNAFKCVTVAENPHLLTIFYTIRGNNCGSRRRPLSIAEVLKLY